MFSVAYPIALAGAFVVLFTCIYIFHRRKKIVFLWRARVPGRNLGFQNGISQFEKKIRPSSPISFHSFCNLKKVSKKLFFHVDAIALAAYAEQLLPHGQSYSAYASNFIASTLKKNFLQMILQVTKTVERDQWTSSDFFLYLADAILKPLIHHMPHSKPLMKLTFCRSNFSAAWHAAACRSPA